MALIFRTTSLMDGNRETVDRNNPAEMYRREQAYVQQAFDGNSDEFQNAITSGALDNYLAAEQLANEIQNSRGSYQSSPTMDDALKVAANIQAVKDAQGAAQNAATIANQRNYVDISTDYVPATFSAPAYVPPTLSAPAYMPQGNLLPNAATMQSTAPADQYDGFASEAERDFYMGLAADPDAANNYSSEVRRLNDRGFLGKAIAGGIGEAGIPVMNDGKIMGVNVTRTMDTPFGEFDYTTYTGRNDFNPSESGFDSGRDEFDDAIVAPIENPMSGTQQCPDGYIFDSDLNACRLAVSAPAAPAEFDAAAYYRPTSLDAAPANVPAGFDFSDANRRFVNSFAYRPDYYDKPMDMVGYSPAGLLSQ